MLKKLGEKEFNEFVTKEDWEAIYLKRVHQLPSKKLAEFSYKFLHRLILCREILCKWKRCESHNCPCCTKPENVKHVYFECKRVRQIWQKIGRSIRINLTWKNIVFGYRQNITIHRVRNLFITVVMYAIFKFWVHGIENLIEYTSSNLWVLIKKDLTIWTYRIQKSKFDKDHRNFKNMWTSIIETLP